MLRIKIIFQVDYFSLKILKHNQSYSYILVTIAFYIGIDAVPFDAALARVLVVVCVGTSPEVALRSVSIVPPRFLHATKPQWCAEAVIY